MKWKPFNEQTEEATHTVKPMFGTNGDAKEFKILSAKGYFKYLVHPVTDRYKDMDLEPAFMAWVNSPASDTWYRKIDKDDHTTWIEQPHKSNPHRSNWLIKGKLADLMKTDEYNQILKAGAQNDEDSVGRWIPMADIKYLTCSAVPKIMPDGRLTSAFFRYPVSIKSIPAYGSKLVKGSLQIIMNAEELAFDGVPRNADRRTITVAKQDLLLTAKGFMKDTTMAGDRGLNYYGYALPSNAAYPLYVNRDVGVSDEVFMVSRYPVIINNSKGSTAAELGGAGNTESEEEMLESFKQTLEFTAARNKSQSAMLKKATMVSRRYNELVDADLKKTQEDLQKITTVNELAEKHATSMNFIFGITPAAATPAPAEATT